MPPEYFSINVTSAILADLASPTDNSMSSPINTTIDLDNPLQQATPQEIVAHALAEHENIAVSFSGAEDVALIDMAVRIKPGIEVFCLDTGRLHTETYEFIETVREHYQLKLSVLFPDADAVQNLVSTKGLFSFYRDNHQECCGIRKVGPLRKKLLTPVIQQDKVFARQGDQLIKYNPLANWTSKQVWEYIRSENVPYNPLHDRGFVSIGCAPCTKAIGPGQHEREGRWWWEEATKKECGLHAGNIDK